MPPKKLLAALDGSEPSEAALRHALDLARPLGAAVEGLFVKDVVVLDAYLLGDLPGLMGASPITQVRGDVDKLFEARGRAVLGEAGAECKEAGVAFSGTLGSGRVAPLVAAAAKSAELAAMGIWGAGADGRSVGGHLMSLLSTSPKPVLASPAPYEKAKRIVVAYDDSPSAKRALKIAVGLAKTAKWPLEIVHVSKDDSGDAVLERARKSALPAGRQAAGLAGLKATILPGEPRSALRELAAEGAGFLLAMGTHGHGFLHDMVLGSTTHHVLDGTNVPVLFVR